MKIGVLYLATAAVTATLALGGCSSSGGDMGGYSPTGTNASDSSKSPTPTMGNLTACQLLQPRQATRIGEDLLFDHLGPPQEVGKQCRYTTGNGATLTIGRGAETAKGGTVGLVAGATSHEIASEADDVCSLDVMLTANDPAEVLSVNVTIRPNGSWSLPDEADTFADTIAKTIIENLPTHP